MTYQNALNQLHNLRNRLHSHARGHGGHTKDGSYNFTGFGLERMRKFARLLGNPERNLPPTIHIAGTSGKGSTTAFASHILTASGYHTGTFYTPAFLTTRDQIQINNTPITETEFTQHWQTLSPIIDQMETSEFGAPSPFEAIFAIALLAFRHHNIQAAAIEVGLGGAIDATNIITSDVAIITNISLAHQRLLGNTLEKIAAQKAGIIKPNQLAVTTPSDQTHLISPFATHAKIPLITASQPETTPIPHPTAPTMRFSYDNRTYTTSMIGDKQAQNAGLAIKATTTLATKLPQITPKSIKSGIEATTYPGRFQLISDTPRILLDAAHSTAKIQFLTQNLPKYYNYDQLIVILAVKNPEEAPQIAQEIAKIADHIILTPLTDQRFAKTQPQITKILKNTLKNHPNTQIAKNPQNALKLAKIQSKTTPNPLILATGSIHLFPEIDLSTLPAPKH